MRHEHTLRLPPLIAALVIVAAFAGVAVALLRIADRRDAERAARPAESVTTLPSAGLDRQPDGGPGTSGSSAPSRATVTTRPLSTAPAPTAAGDEEGAPVLLRGDGIGAFSFGVEPDQVIAGLTLRWGPPDGDTGWVPASSSPYGACPGTAVRGVGWRGFTVLFSDGATLFSNRAAPGGRAGGRHFFTWLYQADDPDRPAADPGGNRPALRTPNGVSVGVTVEVLQRAYGDRLELFDEAPRGPQFGVQTSEGGIFGSLTSLGGGGIVRKIVGGGGCGD